jgi:hypothetical protein
MADSNSELRPSETERAHMTNVPNAPGNYRGSAWQFIVLLGVRSSKAFLMQLGNELTMYWVAPAESDFNYLMTELAGWEFRAAQTSDGLYPR